MRDEPSVLHDRVSTFNLSWVKWEKTKVELNRHIKVTVTVGFKFIDRISADFSTFLLMEAKRFPLDSIYVD